MTSRLGGAFVILAVVTLLITWGCWSASPNSAASDDDAWRKYVSPHHDGTPAATGKTYRGGE